MRFQTILLFRVLESWQAVVRGWCSGQAQPASLIQEPRRSSAAPPESKAKPLPNAKPDKVWTNDEIDTLPSHPSVSLVAKHTPQNLSATSKLDSQEKDPGWYRNQLAILRAEIDKLDPQIAKLQTFLSGKNTSDPLAMHPELVPTPQDQWKQMEDKRQADETKIEDLLGRARHNGIEPRALH